MAITETRNLPAQFIEDLGTDYAKQLTGATAASQALDVSKFAPQVAPQTALQQQATSLTGAGIGSYQPFMTAAQTVCRHSWHWFRISANWIRYCRTRINRSRHSSWYSRYNNRWCTTFY